MNKNRIRLTESQLHRVIKESVNKILKEGKPKDVQHGKHSFKGLRYGKNGNPIYSYNGHPNADTQKLLKNQGWKMSSKHGMYGQISDPSKFYNESVLHNVVKESVNKVLREMTPSKIMAQRNGGTNRSEFRNSDMENDFRNAEPSCIRDARREYDGIPKEELPKYKRLYGDNMFQQGVDYYKENEMNSDWDKYGNPNIR